MFNLSFRDFSYLTIQVLLVKTELLGVIRDSYIKAPNLKAGPIETEVVVTEVLSHSGHRQPQDGRPEDPKSLEMFCLISCLIGNHFLCSWFICKKWWPKVLYAISLGLTMAARPCWNLHLPPKFPRKGPKRLNLSPQLAPIQSTSNGWCPAALWISRNEAFPWK